MSGCCQGLEDEDDIKMCKLFQTQSPTELQNTLNSIGTDKHYLYTTFANCLQAEIFKSSQPLVDLLNNYEVNKIDAVTASEMNKNTMSLYQTDLYYTIGKVFLFFIIILAYYYFLNGEAMIGPIKAGIQSVNDKITKIANEKPVIPVNKIANATVPIK